jgi:hypothetical protein
LPPPLYHKNLKIKKPKKRNKNNASVARKILYKKKKKKRKKASVAGSSVHTFAALYFSPKKYFLMQKERIQIDQDTGFFHKKRNLYFGFY